VKDELLYQRDKVFQQNVQHVCLTIARGDEVCRLAHEGTNVLQKQVSFLGHVVSGEGIKTDPENVKEVAVWLVRVNLREVRSFMGLCSYYRRFMKDFARISSPLHALTKKNASFQCDDE